MSDKTLAVFAHYGAEKLYQEDPELYGILNNEYERQRDRLVMVASSSVVDPSVLSCESMTAVNVTAEGYPGKRYHAGCEYIDEIERLAIERAKQAFKAQFANVQPHSATTANEIVMMSLLKPGETLLGMQLQFGGHLTHGARASISGQYFHAAGYGLNEDGSINYTQVADLARTLKPRLIICGATAYPRLIDFKRFREIADEVGAFLLADISHISGLVIAGLHPSPIDHAHFTTTCTHKQLYGPRGGLILMGRDYNMLAPDGKRTLAEMIQRAVFPFFQGAPMMNAIAAKARALHRATQPEFQEVMKRVVIDARRLALWFVEQGYRVISSGSDNHIVLIDVSTCGNSDVTGIIAEQALQECHIIVNKNRIAGDQRSATITSGIRLGTNTMALRGLAEEEMDVCAQLIHRVLTSLVVLNEREYALDECIRDDVRAQVAQLCARFPIASYASYEATYS